MDIRRRGSATVGFLAGAILTPVLVVALGGVVDATVFHSAADHLPVEEAFYISLIVWPFGGLLGFWLTMRETKKDVWAFIIPLLIVLAAVGAVRVVFN
jgi:peptidoglycan/LPS O-acetylase OafA/YrhL